MPPPSKRKPINKVTKGIINLLFIIRLKLYKYKNITKNLFNICNLTKL